MWAISSLDSLVGLSGGGGTSDVGGRGGASGERAPSASRAPSAARAPSASRAPSAARAPSAVGFGAPGICMDGTAVCEGTTDVRLCLGGQWSGPFTCPTACAKGVCTECLPGVTDCATPGFVRVCDANGIWLAPRPAGVECGGTCKAGETRCASHEAVQTCTPGGQWGTATPCDFVCAGDACGERTRTVFVTSVRFPGGALGGLDGADSLCTKLAAGAGLMGAFRAWLSDDTGVARDAVHAGRRSLSARDGTIVGATSGRP